MLSHNHHQSSGMYVQYNSRKCSHDAVDLCWFDRWPPRGRKLRLAWISCEREEAADLAFVCRVKLLAEPVAQSDTSPI